jgi:pilus assembly protein TadC
MTSVAFALLGLSALLSAPRRPAASVERNRRDRRFAADTRALKLIASSAVVAGLFAAVDVQSAAVGSVLLGPSGAYAVGRLHARGSRPRDSSTARQTPFVLSLLAAALRAGAPISTAVELAAQAADEDTQARLMTVVGLLRLGADPQLAWLDDEHDAAWSAIAQVARQSAESGTRMAVSFDRLAIELRARRHSESAARAERAGVYAVAPLGLCFLPAFVCVGIVPVAVGLWSTMPGM